MISGAHVVIYSKNADEDRAFFRDVLGFKSVDAGHGWLIFALPPAEAAVHPSEEIPGHELYFMCDDLKAEMDSLGKKGAQFSEVQRSTMGFDHEDAACRWRRGRPLSTKASYGVGLEMNRSSSLIHFGPSGPAVGYQSFN